MGESLTKSCIFEWIVLDFSCLMGLAVQDRSLPSSVSMGLCKLTDIVNCMRVLL